MVHDLLLFWVGHGLLYSKRNMTRGSMYHSIGSIYTVVHSTWKYNALKSLAYPLLLDMLLSSKKAWVLIRKYHVFQWVLWSSSTRSIAFFVQLFLFKAFIHYRQHNFDFIMDFPLEMNGYKFTQLEMQRKNAFLNEIPCLTEKYVEGFIHITVHNLLLFSALFYFLWFFCINS